ncbi:peroxiredoxin-like family protein [Cytophaga aurantiaca]|uniref:peroxiredoxin-like family protein n=1 Tax=Cytophaga aurantiaca TaxID=29530 RepID=UPI00036866FF|nr:peroxiredoxin-like family protein [Cytophaga aurantiaca]
MALQLQQTAPDFNITDVFNKNISLHSYKGKKVYLLFMRFAGCPVCNLRVHSLLKQANAFKEKNIEVVLVYESSIENMRTYLDDTAYPYTFVADPQNILYDRYGVEKSWWKFLSSMFKGLIAKALAGEKLFKNKPKADGKVNRMEAEFLIDEGGKIILAHYASFLGDNIPIEKILNG